MKSTPIFPFLLATAIFLTACGGAASAPQNIDAPPAANTAETAPAESPTATVQQPTEPAEPTATGPVQEESPTTESRQEAAVVNTTAPTQEAVENADEPAPTDEPATTEPAPTAEPEEVNWLTVEGKTGDNLTYLGNPDAPVTMIDYSDFM